MNPFISLSHFFRYFNGLKLLGLAVSLIATLFLSGCSGSGTENNAAVSNADNGKLELAITDAEEDFLSYQIELDSITLNRIDGSTVSLLPLQTEIDFVQYQELSELFAVLTVPKGIYTSITLSLDYSNADIVIQDEAGISYQASAVNSAGEAMTKVDVDLKLNDNQSIRISPTKAAQLTLDLDLAASNTIESFEPAVVTVEPFMIGTTTLTEGREHRVRGLLQTTNTEEQTISLKIRPMRLKQGRFGEFTFNVNSETHYEIDGVELKGSAGLTAVSTLSTSTPLVAFGQANKENEQRYVASQVLAGNSVPWNNSDVLKGIITKRVGNTLTIKGAVLESQNREASFRQTVDVNVGDNSIVTGYKLGDADISNLSIGQRILALGQFDTENDTFNAENGSVRMKMNKIVGEVAQVSPLELNLSHINKRPVEIFDFTGTGTSVNDDANPDHYKIDTGSLDLGTVDLNEWLQVQGYPTALGSAPMDFDALTIVNPNFVSHRAKLHTRWSENSTGNVTVNNDILVLNNANAQSKLHLVGIPASSKLGLTVDKVSGNDEAGIYGLLVKGRGIQLYREFSDFITAVKTEIDKGSEVVNLTGAGHYSDSQHTLEASYLTLRLNSSEIEHAEDLELSEDLEADDELETDDLETL